MSRAACMLALIAMLAGGCGDDEAPPTGTDGAGTPTIPGAGLPCTPGREVPCFCDFSPGTQTCLSSGYELGPCRCSDPAAPDGDAGSSSSSDTAATATDETTAGTAAP